MLYLTDQASLVNIAAIEGPETPRRRRLIAAGEVLLGERGIEGIALHKIAKAAGQSNTYAIQYHFGSLDGLIDAIFALRMVAVQARRERLIARAEHLGLLENIPALVEALLLPIAEQVDENGRHSYVRFWLQYRIRPVTALGQMPDYTPKNPSGLRIFERLSTLLAIDLPQVTQRITLLSSLMHQSLIARDNARSIGAKVPPLEEEVAGIVAVVAAALEAKAWPRLAPEVLDVPTAARRRRKTSTGP